MRLIIDENEFAQFDLDQRSCSFEPTKALPICRTGDIGLRCDDVGEIARPRLDEMSKAQHSKQVQEMIG